jgi:hypothetical protein
MTQGRIHFSIGFYIFAIFFLSAFCLFATNETQNGFRFVNLKRIETVLDIDGNLNEPEWEDAPVIGELAQVEPVEFGVPSKKTDVKILFNENYIYFGIICYEDNPQDIISHELERDGDTDTSDYISIVLDTFLDHRNGYNFIVTPAGARIDATINNNSEEVSLDWDGIWYAKTSTTSFGWIVEIAIPFKTLTFDPLTNSWGFNFARVIRRNQEVLKWAYPSRNAYMSNLSTAGEIRGITNIKQGIGLDARPFAVGTDSVDKNGTNDQGIDAGADLFYNITANLKVSVTVNTDFAETEVDERQINLTRFPITYPEKRDFFLEGADLFKLQKMAYTVVPFFSRRIGLFEGVQVPINWGAKITGRIGEYNIGFLDVQTDDTSSLKSQNLLAMRITRNLWDQSYIGMIFTNGNPSGDGYNRLYGADFHYGTSQFAGDLNLFIDANYIHSDSENLPDKDNDQWLVAVDFPNDKYDFYFEFQSIGENFNPALGFTQRNGVKLANSNFSWMPRPDWEPLRKMILGWHLGMVWDSDGGLSETEGALDLLHLVFESGDEVEMNLIYKYDRLVHDFEISDGIKIPLGEYSFFNGNVYITTSQKRDLSGYLGYQWGDYYEGDRKILNIGLEYKPSENIYLSSSIIYNDINLPAGDFTAEIYSFRFNYNLSADLSWKNLVQYDNESKILGLFSKLRWIIEEGNDLYFVVQRNWIDDGGLFRSYDWKVDLKFYYTFRL